MDQLWIWIQAQGAPVALLCLAVWRLDQHLSLFRSDLGSLHRQLLDILSRAAAPDGK